MIIDNATIKMQAGLDQQQRTERKQSLEFRHARPENRAPHPRESIHKDRLQLSDAGKLAGTQSKQLDLEKQPQAEHSLTLQIIRRMVKELTGLEFNLFSPEALQGQADEVVIQEPQQAPAQTDASEAGLVYQQSLAYFESQTTTFNAAGTINTQDGQSIDFSVSLSMSRSFYLETNLTVQSGAVPKIDPLVFNFEGTAAELSSTTFQFDIDANGSLDQIATLKSNSGMLALDKNQDGKINDGSELFGPKTGNGFNELAAYDEDHNQFIDAADSIYKQLRIWQRHADGSQQLLALGAKNIGAIFLGHISTPFQINTEDHNQPLGEVASSGVYWHENGQVGTVQQINFTV